MRHMGGGGGGGGWTTFLPSENCNIPDYYLLADVITLLGVTNIAAFVVV